MEIQSLDSKFSQKHSVNHPGPLIGVRQIDRQIHRSNFYLLLFAVRCDHLSDHIGHSWSFQVRQYLTLHMTHPYYLAKSWHYDSTGTNWSYKFLHSFDQ